MKKLVSLLLLICLMFTCVSADYYDTDTHWAKSSIDRWSSLGIINGYEGYFRPDDTITRGEMAVILDRIIKYRSTADNTFSDLDNNFYYDAVLKVNKAGVMLGYDNLVRPNDSITREEAGVMICRAFEITSDVKSNAYTVETASDWALDPLNTLHSLSYLNNIEGFKEPKGNITRAETVVLLDNIIGEIISESGEYNDTYDGLIVINTSDVLFKNATINGNVVITEGANGGNVTFTMVALNGKVIKQCNSDVFKITNPETEGPKATETPVPSATPTATATPEVNDDYFDDEEPEESDESVVSLVSVSINAEIIGAGNLITQEVIEFENEMTVAGAIALALENCGYTYENSGSIEDNFYITSILGVPPFTPVISEDTAIILQENGVDFSADDYVEGVLGELSFTVTSGWLYKINDEFGNVSMSVQEVYDGDEIELCFSLIYGLDIGFQFE